MKPRKRSPCKRLVKRLDDLWRELIRSRAYGWTGERGCCDRCDHYRALQAAHGVPRSRGHHTRWERSNGLALCSACHMLVDQDAHEKVALWTHVFGAEEWERLNALKRETGRVDLDAIERDLAARVEALD